MASLSGIREPTKLRFALLFARKHANVRWVRIHYHSSHSFASPTVCPRSSTPQQRPKNWKVAGKDETEADAKAGAGESRTLASWTAGALASGGKCWGSGRPLRWDRKTLSRGRDRAAWSACGPLNDSDRSCRRRGKPQGRRLAVLCADRGKRARYPHNRRTRARGKVGRREYRPCRGCRDSAARRTEVDERRTLAKREIK